MEYSTTFSMTEDGFRTGLEYGQLVISGDENQGFRPYQLMTASIACCSGGVLRKILKKQRMDIDDLKVRAAVTRGDTDTKRMEKIHLHFVISGSGLDQKKIEKAVDLGFKHCSMVQSVKDSIAITESFEIAAG
jgi:putative redox protein